MKQNAASIQSKGGDARAAKLSKQERTRIASTAAAARWGIPKATHESEIVIGEISIPCAVLEDGTRILSQSGFLRALGRSEKPGGTVFDETMRIVGAKNLTPFIGNELMDSMTPIRYTPKNGGRALGFKAEVLPKVCEVYLAARAENLLHHTQERLARAAEIIIRGLANLGIIALVDEATGYQYERARNALGEILERFIAKELQPWTKTFPTSFYEEIFRLKDWTFDAATMQGPRVISTYTIDIVYKRLAPGVLNELKAKNPPVAKGKRKNKLFQWLTGEVGHPQLKAHIEAVTALMRVSDDWTGFKRLLDRAYPIIEVTELGIETEVRMKKIGS